MLIFRLREKFKNEHVEDCLKQLLLNESMSCDELKKWQLVHLKELLLYVCEHVPYFKEYAAKKNIDKSFKSNDVNELLSLFAISDKNLVRDNFDKWLTDELSYDKIHWGSTSGSTGIPFKFHTSQIAGDYKTASKYRLYHRFGVRIDDNQMCFGASFNQGQTKIQKIKADFNNRFVNKRYFIDTTRLSKEALQQEINRINRLPIKSLWGYPSAIFEVAKFALDNNISISNNKLKVIFYSGEGHDDNINQVVKAAFGDSITIVDEFNSVEGFIAGTYQDGSLHLNDDTAIFEVLKPDGTISSSGKGELLITSLFNKEFPFIRYKNGDVVDISESTGNIGVPFRILNSADGRSSSFIYNGTIKVPHAICTHYMPHSNYKTQVKKFQIIQNEKNSVIVKIAYYDENNLDKKGIEEMFRSLFDQIEVYFEYVDDIPREKSGKFRDVVQNVKG